MNYLKKLLSGLISNKLSICEEVNNDLFEHIQEQNKQIKEYRKKINVLNSNLYYYKNK